MKRNKTLPISGTCVVPFRLSHHLPGGEKSNEIRLSNASDCHRLVVAGPLLPEIRLLSSRLYSARSRCRHFRFRYEAGSPWRVSSASSAGSGTRSSPASEIMLMLLLVLHCNCVYNMYCFWYIRARSMAYLVVSINFILVSLWSVQWMKAVSWWWIAVNYCV